MIDTNTAPTIDTTIVAVTTKVNKLRGRKPRTIVEISDKTFTITDLLSLNSNIKVPTLRAFVSRRVVARVYSLVGTQPLSGRGKPANLYRKA